MSGRNSRFINTLILILLVLLALTGVYGLYFPLPSSLFEIHRIAGWGFILLIPWKTVVAVRSLKRGADKRPDRRLTVVVSVLLAITTLVLLALGLMWKWNLGEYYVWIAGYGYSGIGWHWGIALYLSPLFILHAWRRWHRPKPADVLGRRQALKLMGLGIASIAAWGASEKLAKTLESDGIQRRFTGSREEGSFAGNAHPVTSGPSQGRIKLDPGAWTLGVRGAVETPLTLTYAEALALSNSKVTATLDCTGGWYTIQTWRGIRLTDLLRSAGLRGDAIGVTLQGVFEYTAPFTLAQAQEILLATHVGDEVLNHVHGFPMRAVVPSRRGWHWVKWLTEIRVSDL